MADYYHTSREHVKNLKAMQDQAARRAERRTELAEVSAEQPINLLRVDGRAVKLFRSTEQYRAVESLEGMLPWNGNQENLIDRFDGRALLDFYKDPVARRSAKSEEELQLDEMVAFEAYRDLVKLLQKGLDDRAGIEAAKEENIQIRAQARAAATAAAGASANGNKAASTAPAGSGMYGAVGFAYDAAGAVESDASGSEDASSEEGSEDEQELAEEGIDNLAANLGIDGFSAMLRRTERQEAELAAGNVKRAKRMFSRKKAAQRAKRMAGQGLDAFPKDFVQPSSTTALALATRERVERARAMSRRSPSYERSRSRSHSPRRRGDRPRTQFITSFADEKPQRRSRDHESHLRLNREGHADAGPSQRNESFLDALPSRVDPSTDGGPVSLPAAAVVMQGRRASDRDSRSRYPYESERASSDSKRKQSAANPSKDSKSKETPMERLKRLRATQLNKTFQKEVLTNAQRKANEERDRAARLQIERSAYADRRGSPSSPPRYSESPPNRYSVSPGRRY